MQPEWMTKKERQEIAHIQKKMTMVHRNAARGAMSEVFKMFLVLAETRDRREIVNALTDYMLVDLQVVSERHDRVYQMAKLSLEMARVMRLLVVREQNEMPKLMPGQYSLDDLLDLDDDGPTAA